MFVDPSLSHYPSDCRFQESSRPGQSSHNSIHADSQPPAPLGIGEHPITPQLEDLQMVDERIPQSQAISPALIGPAGPPPDTGFRRSSAAPHPPDEDEDMHNVAGGGITPISESRETTPRPRPLSKGKGRVIYSDDEENMGESSGRPPTPRAQEAHEPRQVSFIVLRPSSRHNFFP